MHSYRAVAGYQLSIAGRKKMLYYVSNADLPSKKAHTVQQVRMCQAFQRAGVQVSLLHPSHRHLRKQVTWDTLADFYRLDTRFDVQTVPTLQSRVDSVPRIGLLSMMGSMTAWLGSRILAGRMDSDDIVYGRNYYAMFLFNELRHLLPASRRPTLVFEHHDTISAHLKPRLFSTVDACVTTSNRLKEYDCAEFGMPPESGIVAHHGVALNAYEQLDRQTVRERLGLPEGKQIVAYTGHLYPRKGVQTLVRAADNLDAMVYVVGGYTEDIHRIRSEVDVPESVTFTGFVEPAEMPAYQTAADVLVAPYAPSTLEINFPLKLFEYLAAGRPIVVSDHQIVREVLTDGEDSVFFDAGSVDSLADSVQAVLNDEQRAATLGANAAETAQQYSYESRAERILSHVRNQ